MRRRHDLRPSENLAPPSPLSLTALTPTSIPSFGSPAYASFKSSLLDSSTALARSLSSSSPEWKQGKTFNKAVGQPTATCVSRKPPGGGETQGFKWHARTSRHKDKWEAFRDALLVNHSVNESKYIEDCVSAKRIQVFEEGVLEVWQMSYHLPFPTTNRDFVILIYTIDTSQPTIPGTPPSPRSFQVVSVPCEHPEAPVRKGWIRGKYVSVEEVVEEGDEVVWRMATASNAKGAIPRAITELAMPSKISEDVPSLITRFKKQAAKA